MRPIDTLHLEAQTFGDRELRDNVLRLFIDQATTVETSLDDPAVVVSALITDLHRLRGAARAVGANDLGDHLERLENVLSDRRSGPAPVHDIRRLATALDAARADATSLLAEVERGLAKPGECR